jgi:DNA mismatch repair protein MutS
MSAASDPADTPMFTQYRALKARCPDALLFFRMGDFYELFFDDAVVAARELELTLTSRNKADPNPIPMCGVPHHAAAGYLQKLTDRGYKVAIGEQTEDPSVAKGLVARDITRVVTPGVVFDPTALEAASTCFIAAVARVRDTFGVAFLDVSTGDLRGTDVKGEAALLGELVRFDPKELLLAPGAELTAETLAAIDELGPADSEVDAEAWTPSVARREVEDTLGVADWLGQGVRGDEVFLRAAGAALRYVRDNTGHRPENVTRLRPYAVHGLMVLDAVDAAELGDVPDPMLNTGSRRLAVPPARPHRHGRWAGGFCGSG